MRDGDYVSVFIGGQDGARVEMRARVLAARQIGQGRILAEVEFTSGPFKGERPQPYVFNGYYVER